MVIFIPLPSMHLCFSHEENRGGMVCQWRRRIREGKKHKRDWEEKEETAVEAVVGGEEDKGRKERKRVTVANMAMGEREGE